MARQELGCGSLFSSGNQVKWFATGRHGALAFPCSCHFWKIHTCGFSRYFQHQCHGYKRSSWLKWKKSYWELHVLVISSPLFPSHITPVPVSPNFYLLIHILGRLAPSPISNQTPIPVFILNISTFCPLLSISTVTAFLQTSNISPALCQISLSPSLVIFNLCSQSLLLKNANQIMPLSASNLQRLPLLWG